MKFEAKFTFTCQVLLELLKIIKFREGVKKTIFYGQADRKTTIPPFCDRAAAINKGEYGILEVE